LARYRLPIHSGKVEATSSFPCFLGHSHFRQAIGPSGIRQGIGFPLSKIRFLTSPVVQLSKIFARFPEQIPTFQPSLKNIFDFLLTLSTPSPIVTL
jgi:hypothetical protein